MNIFKSTSRVETLRAARDKTSVKLDAETAAFENARIASTDAAVNDADDKTIDRLIDNLRRIELRKSAFECALAKANQVLAEAVADEEARADLETRRTTAADISTRAEAIEAAAPIFYAELDTLSAAVEGGRPPHTC